MYLLTYLKRAYQIRIKWNEVYLSQIQLDQRKNILSLTLTSSIRLEGLLLKAINSSKKNRPSGPY